MENVPSEFKKYIEPFCGSACLFFELSPKKAVLGDINEDLILALCEIRDNPRVREELINKPKTKEEYYKIRSINPVVLSDSERAIRFLYLNRLCFNGVYRTNMKGMFNVPMGNRTGDFPSEDVFTASQKLKNANIIKSGYLDTLKKARKGDFVYMDPPYSKGDKFTGEYGVGSFDASEMDGFVSILNNLDEKGIKFLFSYRACEDIASSLSKRFHVETVSVDRHVSGFKEFRGKSQEILVKNYD